MQLWRLNRTVVRVVTEKLEAMGHRGIEWPPRCESRRPQAVQDGVEQDYMCRRSPQMFVAHGIFVKRAILHPEDPGLGIPMQ